MIISTNIQKINKEIQKNNIFRVNFISHIKREGAPKKTFGMGADEPISPMNVDI